MGNYESLIKRHRLKVRLSIALLIAVIVIGALLFKYYLDNRSFDEYQIENTYKIEDPLSREYYSFGDGMLVFSHDGIAYKEGNTSIWNQSFEIKKPVIDICNDTMAICDLETNTVYIYNTEKLLGKIKTTYPVIDLEVSNQGVVAVISKESKTNIIEVLDKEGKIIASGQTYLQGEGMPVDITLSEDGTKLAASYVYLDGKSAKTKVVFYNYTEIGKNEVGRIVGGFNQYKESLVPLIEFINNDNVVAFGDNIYTQYTVEEKPSILKESKFNKKVKSIVYTNEYYAIVFETENYDKPYNLKIYNLQGEIITDIKMSFFYKEVSIKNDTVVFNNDSNIKIYSIDGKEKYSGSFKGGIAKVIQTNKTDIFYIINNDGINEVKFK
jgi:hypothetical protein